MGETTSGPVSLPDDLAELLIADGVASPAHLDMSAAPGLLESVVTVSATVITLAQGPLTAHQLAAYLRRWRSRRIEREQGMGMLYLRHPTGLRVKFPVSQDSDMEEAGRALSELLQAMQVPRVGRRSRGFDDWDDD